LADGIAADLFNFKVHTVFAKNQHINNTGTYLKLTNSGKLLADGIAADLYQL
jgi:hypothetical protein